MSRFGTILAKGKWLIVAAFLATSLSTYPVTDEMKCLADNIHFEARGESEKGMLAVALVTINRTKDPKFPSSICGVVYQKGQFSWTRAFKPKRIQYSDKVMEIAMMAIAGTHNMQNFDALYFHNKNVKPNWKRTKTAVIGNHVFYK